MVQLNIQEHFNRGDNTTYTKLSRSHTKFSIIFNSNGLPIMIKLDDGNKIEVWATYNSETGSLAYNESDVKIKFVKETGEFQRTTYNEKEVVIIDSHKESYESVSKNKNIQSNPISVDDVRNNGTDFKEEIKDEQTIFRANGKFLDTQARQDGLDSEESKFKDFVNEVKTHTAKLTNNQKIKVLWRNF